MENLFTKLSRKQLRIVTRCLTQLERKSAYHFPNSLRDLTFPEYLQREVKLPNNRATYLTDSGLEALDRVQETYSSLRKNGSHFTENDVKLAVRGSFNYHMAHFIKAPSVEELQNDIHSYLFEKLTHRTFLVPINGISLKKYKTIKLIDFTLTRDPKSLTEKSTKTDKLGDFDLVACNYHCWLSWRCFGTSDFADSEFRIKARQFLAIISTTAAILYENGSYSLSVNYVMEPRNAITAVDWFSWSERSNYITYHRHFMPQKIELSGFFLEYVLKEGEIRNLNRIVCKGDPTSLERSIQTALLWSYEANNDDLLTARFVKYWTCIELFFPNSQRAVRETIAAGLSSILIFGGIDMIPTSEITKTYKEITRLYNLRSRAIHGGSHESITTNDVMTLSRWIGWLLMTMSSFTRRGYTDARQVEAQAKKLISGLPTINRDG